MNRGNLAEDPRVDRPSSSRYSRYDDGENRLLYVSDREWKKASGSEEGRSGRDRKVHSNHYSHDDHKGVSADRTGVYSGLEVGKHGRLFGVKVNPSAPEKAADRKAAEQRTADRKAAEQRTADRKAAEQKRTKDQQAKMEKAQRTFESKKPARPYLDAPNPLIDRHILHDVKASSRAERRKAEAERRRESGRQRRILPQGITAESAAACAIGRAAADDTRKKTMSTRKMLLASAAGVLAALYIGAGMHYDGHFYPGTEFFGIDASGMTVSEVKKLVGERVGSYSLTLQGRAGSDASKGISDTITAEQVGLKYRDNGMIDLSMKKQYSAFWPVMLVRSLIVENHATLGTEFDQAKAEKAMENLAFFDKSRVTAPRDAELKFDEDGAYVSKEVMGTTLDPEKTKQAILRALNDGSTYIDLNKEGLYLNPNVFSDDGTLNGRAKALNKVLGASLTIDLGDQSQVLDPEAVADKFLTMDRDGNYFVDADKVAAYAEDLADQFDTVGDEREFETSLGTTVELSGGDYGWQLDAETTGSDLMTAICDKDKGEFEPTWYVEGYSCGTDDIGDTYVEIDLTNQRMWFYRDGSLIVDTPVVTGNPLKGNETPSGGVWSLKGKYRKATLKGEGYATPVDYWMPFNGGVGIHDLQSRYYFGGQVYNGAGSHGCVNTPLAAVKLIYANIETGTPVIVYKDESESAVSQNLGMQDIGTITANIEARFGTVSDDGASDGTGGQTFETDQAASAGRKGGAQ